MWTIIKSVLRFFRSSKLSIIGLFLLIFFSTGIFTVLNNTNINLKKSYETISVNGNLHDFVINENFSLGYANYEKDGDPTGNGTDTTKTQKFKPSTLNNSSDSDWTNSYEIIRQKYYKPNQSEPYLYSEYFVFSISYKTEEELQQKLSDKLSALANFTSKQIKIIYDDELKKLPVSFRRFTSLNINNTKQNIFYKVVESSTEYEIDKLVYYRDGYIYNGNDKLSKPTNLYNLIFDNFSTDTLNKSRLLAEYLYKASWSDSNAQKQFESLWTYTKSNPSFNPYTDINGLDASAKKAQQYLKNLADFAMGKETNGKDFINNKIYNLTFTLSGSTAPITGKYEDFSSYEIVVSPDYLSNNSKKIYPYDDWRNHISDTQKEFDAWFQTIPDTYKVYIDSTPYIIIGTGISPDFMYPVVSFSNVVPNKEKEQVVYTNNNGYERIYDAFRGSEIEAFIVGKFNSNVTNKQRILDQINSLSAKYMSWPTNIKPAYMFDDTSNTLSPTALRVQFVPQIVRTVSVVSAFLTTFVLALSIFVSTVIIRRFIDNNRNSLGIMQANGYKKVEIIFAICLLVGIPTVLGSVIGYTIGFLLQWKAILLLGGFWTVPTLISPFSIAVLLGVCLFILVLFLGICILFSWISLRGETSEFMKDDAKYKMSRLSEYMKKPFKQFSIMTRFKSSVAFLSLWRLIILSVMSSALMLSLTFSLATYDRFDYSAKKSFEPRNYLYSLNLTTPTVQGGQYYAVPYTAQGMSLNKNRYFNVTPYTEDEIKVMDPKDLITQNYLTNDSGYKNYKDDQTFFDYVTKYGNYQLVSSVDSKLQKTRIDYLTYNTTTKALADINLGIAGTSLSANPWSIAERLMPPNNSNYAKERFKGMFEKMITDTKNEITLSNQTKTYKDALMSFTKEVGQDSSASTAFYDSNTGNYRVFDDKKIVNLWTKIQKDFVILVLSVYENPDYAEFSYNINYNKIIVNKNDEPYSYINFNIEKINGKNSVIADSLNAIGIDKNTKRILLKNENDIQINNKLNQNAEVINNVEYYPIIINEFAKKQYGLNIGDTLEVKVANTTDRYSRDYYSKDGEVPDVLAHFKVVDITTTYRGSEFFISRYDANKILGLEINNKKIPLPTKISDLHSTVDWSTVKDLPAKKDFVSEISGFNGIFSTDENLVEVTQGVSIYSPSGIYAAVDKIENNATIRELFAATPEKNGVPNYQKIKDLTGFDGITSVDSAMTILSSTFGQSSSFTILSQADSRNSLFAVFQNLTTTTNNVQTVVLSIIIIVSLLIVILISSMIIGDSIKLASILKCLGYPDDKNAGTFLAVYFPVFLLGLIISIPFSLLINFIYVNIIFHFAGILLVMSFVWWHYVLSASSVIIIFLCSYWIAWYRIKKMNLTRAIK